MRRLWAALAAIVMYLALGVPPALAQDAVEEVPAGVTFVTGTEGCHEPTPGIWHKTAWGGYERGDAHWCEVTMSDPRVSGSWFNAYNVDCYGVEAEPAFFCVLRGTRVLDGPDGGWDCTWTGTDFPAEHDGLLMTGLCPGTGGYEGLTYVFQFSTPAIVGGGTIRGAIYEGPPVVGPEAITDPVEVVVAGRDAVAGYIVLPALQYMSRAELGPDVFTDPLEVKGRKAAVEIPAGTPITPDLLEPTG